jgi:hypothetical protein
MYRQNVQILRSNHTVPSCVLYVPHNEETLLLYTTLNVKFTLEQATKARGGGGVGCIAQRFI